jgi:hypothetical protein
MAGSEMAVTFSQYWKACTNVIPFMPPRNTLAVMSAPTPTTPTQYGVPRMARRVTPAPFSCGRR